MVIESLFYEDVQKFLDDNGIRYIPNVSFLGKSKLPTNYDFAIAGSNKVPERLIKVVNRMNTDQARNIIFSWNDTKDGRREDTKLYAFIQDSEEKVSKDALEALKQYDIHPTLWSERNAVLGELVA